jgi:RHS repeat-associated protein
VTGQPRGPYLGVGHLIAPLRLSTSGIRGSFRPSRGSKKIDASTLKDIITDAKGSVVATGDAGGLHARGYAPYGYAPPADSAHCALGYDGEYTDPVTGDYHLGNGYRAYSPTLMRFTAPDAWAPFGGGGLNTYAYCAGNPVNASDPSGHTPKWADDVALGLVTAALLAVAIDNARDAYLACKLWQKSASSAGEALEGADPSVHWWRMSRRPRARIVAKGIGHGVVAGKNIAGVGIGIASITAHAKQRSVTHNANGTTSTSKLHGVADWGPDALAAILALDAFAYIGRGIASRRAPRARRTGDIVEHISVGQIRGNAESGGVMAGARPRFPSSFSRSRSASLTDSGSSDHPYAVPPDSAHSYINDSVSRLYRSQSFSWVSRSQSVGTEDANQMLSRASPLAIRHTWSDPELYLASPSGNIRQRWGSSHFVRIIRM